MLSAEHCWYPVTATKSYFGCKTSMCFPIEICKEVTTFPMTPSRERRERHHFFLVGIKTGVIYSSTGTDWSMNDGTELQVPTWQPELNRSRQRFPHSRAPRLAAGTHCNGFAAGSAGCHGPTVNLRSVNTLCWHVNLLLAGNARRDSKREQGERWGGSQVTEHFTEC